MPSELIVPTKSDDNFPTLPSGYVMIRKLLINSAVNFLNNPRLKLTSIDDKKAFLSKKGLTQDEIDLAFEISVSRPLNEDILKKELDLLAGKNISFSNKFLNLIYKLFIWGGFIYGLYSLYQEKIRPYLYKTSNKVDRPEEIISNQINQLHDQIVELSRNIIIIKEFISTYCKFRDNSDSKISDELKSIKALLIDKNQFPLVPSIPQWQLIDNKDDSKKNSIE